MEKNIVVLLLWDRSGWIPRFSLLDRSQESQVDCRLFFYFGVSMEEQWQEH